MSIWLGASIWVGVHSQSHVTISMDLQKACHFYPSHSPPMHPQAPMSSKCVLRLHFYSFFGILIRKQAESGASGHTRAYGRDGRVGRVFDIHWLTPILKLASEYF